MADAGRRNGSMRPVYAASLVTIIALLPVFLVGPMSVLMQHDLHFTDAQLGLGVSAYFAAASLAAVPNGRFAERLGARRTLAVSAAGSGIVLLGMTLAWSWAVIFACLAIGGVMNTLSQLGANLRLAGTVPMSRQGYAFGIKQAGPPVVTLFGGLAVPAVAIHFGWRWVFAAATTVAVITTAVMLLRHGRQAGNSRSGARPAISARAPLVVLGAAAGFATAANAATATFLVPYLVFVGIEAGTAGIVLAVASLAATAARVHAGWRADHRDGGNLLVIAAMLAIGAMCARGYRVRDRVGMAGTFPASHCQRQSAGTRGSRRNHIHRDIGRRCAGTTLLRAAGIDCWIQHSVVCHRWPDGDLGGSDACFSPDCPARLASRNRARVRLGRA